MAFAGERIIGGEKGREVEILLEVGVVVGGSGKSLFEDRNRVEDE